MVIETDEDYQRVVQRISELTLQPALDPLLESELDDLLGDLYEFELINQVNPEDIERQQLLAGLADD
ncbi:hypothetical protein [Candidatus Cyanaurora vandensis]|uniref:hypothetical protein n=1 Tax=Candidatus Cyanaurora vandensis TaxID=2714958 RepID=UPI00257B1787|nr:hypothetical protein [Candidatus Cyanaurora vandensis]